MTMEAEEEDEAHARGRELLSGEDSPGDSDPDWDETEHGRERKEEEASSRPARKRRKKAPLDVPLASKRQREEPVPQGLPKPKKKRKVSFSHDIPSKKWEENDERPVRRKKKKQQESNAAASNLPSDRAGRRERTSSQDRDSRADEPSALPDPQGDDENATSPALHEEQGEATLQKGARRKKRKLRSLQKSRFRGVRNSARREEANKWTAEVYMGCRNGRGKYYTLSTAFNSDEEAARGYDRASIAIFGPEEARTNFPIETYGEEVTKLEGEELHKFLAGIRREVILKNREKAGAGKSGRTAKKSLTSRGGRGRLRPFSKTHNPHKRCGMCINCITRSGGSCLETRTKIKAKKAADAAALGEPRTPKKKRGKQSAVWDAAIKMKDRYDQQEKERLTASITADDTDGIDSFVQGSSPFNPLGQSETAEPDLQHDYFQDLTAISRRQADGKGFSFAAPSQPRMCHSCNTTLHGIRSKCPLLWYGDEKQSSDAPKKSAKGKKDLRRKRRKFNVAPRLRNIVDAFQDIQLPAHQEVFPGGPPRQNRKLLTEAEAVACVLLLDEVIGAMNGEKPQKSPTPRGRPPLPPTPRGGSSLAPSQAPLHSDDQG